MILGYRKLWNSKTKLSVDVPHHEHISHSFFKIEFLKFPDIVKLRATTFEMIINDLTLTFLTCLSNMIIQLKVSLFNIFPKAPTT